MRRHLILALAGCLLILGNLHLSIGQEPHKHDRIFGSVVEARKSPAEKLAYVVATYAGTDVRKPDYLATIDVDPQSKTYSQVIHRLKMPHVGDELHHFGWN